jgi:RNA polymerase sigma-70 factor (ECF subfamily)
MNHLAPALSECNDLPPPDEDRAWIDRFREGDESGFDLLVGKYQRQVERLAFRILGDSTHLEDVVQDVFLVVFTRLRDFRGQSGFATWLTRITVNQCRSALRRRRIARRCLFWMRSRPATRSAPIQAGEAAETAEAADLVRSRVHELKEKYRLPIVLRYFEGHPIAEIAEILDLSPGTVEVRISRAKRILREALSKEKTT